MWYIHFQPLFCWVDFVHVMHIISENIDTPPGLRAAIGLLAIMLCCLDSNHAYYVYVENIRLLMLYNAIFGMELWWKIWFRIEMYNLDWLWTMNKNIHICQICKKNSSKSIPKSGFSQKLIVFTDWLTEFSYYIPNNTYILVHTYNNVSTNINPFLNGKWCFYDSIL